MLVIALQKGCYRWEILALLVVDGYLYIVLQSTFLVVLSYLLLSLCICGTYILEQFSFWRARWIVRAAQFRIW